MDFLRQCRRAGLLLALLLGPLLGQAQRQYDSWYFGNHVGLQFAPGQYWPQQLTQSSMYTFESCTSLADSLTGSLLLYSNGEQVWDRTHQLMPNGSALGGHQSASEGALAVFAPGQPGRAYIFTLDAKENQLRNGLRYSVVDLRLRGGLGDVVQKSVPLPLPGGVLATEHLSAVRQANGRDFWVVTHGFDNNSFYAYALTPAGVAAQPVVSTIGPSAGPNIENSTGTLHFSPSGRELAFNVFTRGLYLLDFDPATGRVSNALTLDELIGPAMNLNYRSYSSEFSPDGSLLYADVNQVVGRYDLLAGSPAAIRASLRLFTTKATTPLLGSLRRGPNGRLYVVYCFARTLTVIDSCNSVQQAYLRPAIQPLSGPPQPYAQFASAEYCLPNFPGGSLAWHPPTAATTGPEVAEGFVVDVGPGCAGQATRLAVRPRGSGHGGIGQVQWRIGGGASPLVLSGLAVAPVFGLAGAQAVYVVVEFADGTRQVQALALMVPPLATVALTGSVRQLACGEPTAELQAAASTAGRFSWDDDTTRLARRVVSAPGTYRVHFVSAAGCLATDSVTITQLAGGDCLIPNIILPDGGGLNQRFVLKGYEVGRWALTMFDRWGRQVYANPRYANEWEATGQSAGLYYYLLQHSVTGTRLRSWVEVVR